MLIDYIVLIWINPINTINSIWLFSSFGKDHILLRGFMILPEKLLQEKVDYKYVALDKEEDSVLVWEVLYTASSVTDYKRNRLFKIIPDDLKSSKYIIESKLIIYRIASFSPCLIRNINVTCIFPIEVCGN